METLILRFKSKKNYELVKELASLLEDREGSYGTKKKTATRRKSTTEKGLRAMSRTSKNKIISKEELRKQLPKSKFASDEELRALSGIAKGQLISKEHLRSLSWKKRNW
ncbi:MAG: hypothetical protein HY015_03230 [Bacteroidetes bacterium]|nr:hypothetical protein [Bacteroidota bacterium]MBI3481979.1 hypothetical protein [Bacteroidota bacterium]